MTNKTYKYRGTKQPICFGVEKLEGYIIEATEETVEGEELEIEDESNEVVAHISGFKIADVETLANRKAVCDTCQYWYAKARMGLGKYLKCGCTSAKLKLASEKCPIGKW